MLFTNVLRERERKSAKPPFSLSMLLLSFERKKCVGSKVNINAKYPVDYFNTFAFHCKEKRPGLTRRVHYKNLDLTITAGLGARK